MLSMSAPLTSNKCRTELWALIVTLRGRAIPDLDITRALWVTLRELGGRDAQDPSTQDNTDMPVSIVTEPSERDCPEDVSDSSPDAMDASKSQPAPMLNTAAQPAYGCSSAWRPIAPTRSWAAKSVPGSPSVSHGYVPGDPILLHDGREHSVHQPYRCNRSILGRSRGSIWKRGQASVGRTPAGYCLPGGGGCVNVETACLLTVNPSPIPSRQISVTGHRSLLTTIVADFKSFLPRRVPNAHCLCSLFCCGSAIVADHSSPAKERGVLMLTVIETRYGGHITQIVCDGCKQPITNLSTAIVVCADSEDGDGTSAFYHSHKDDDCQFSVRQAARHYKWGRPWDEVADHLILLAIHAGLHPGTFAQRYDDLWERNTAPEPSACDDGLCSV